LLKAPAARPTSRRRRAFDTSFNGGCHDAFVARIADHVPLQVFRRGIGHGSTTSDPDGIGCGATCSAWHELDTTVKLTATPAFGSVFTGWYGCDFVDGHHGWVTMSKARLVTARFFGIPLW